MHYSSIAFTLAITASIAYADQDFNEDGFGAFRPREMSQNKYRPCWERALTVGDKCYFKSPLYQAKSRTQKMTELWGKIVSGDQEPRKQAWADFPKFFTEKSNNAFCQRSDEKPWRLTKNTHTQGLVAQVQWKAEVGHGYSGIFQEGSNEVIMRLSDANFLYDGASGHTPSAAFKFLIDGQESENIFAQHSLVPSDSWNFFKGDISNRIKKIGDPEDHFGEASQILAQTVIPKMVEGSQRPFALAVSQLADRYKSGELIKPMQNVKSPFELRFRAPEKIKKNFSDEQPEQPWYEMIHENVSAGEVIYEVFAFTPKYWTGPKEDTEVKIAEIVLTSDLKTSKWADERLYFKHKHVYNDYKFMPRGLKWPQHDQRFDDDVTNWGMETPEWPTDPVEAKDKYISEVKNYACPFAWLLESD